LQVRLIVLFCAIVLVFGGAAASGASSSQAGWIARGKYLVSFGACNDCHTPGWRESFGNVSVSQWMTGTSIGFRGPWGTVYPANVRQRFTQISEDEWLAMVKSRDGHPPMTWHDVRALTIDDQRSIYRFIRSLGPAGSPSLSDVPSQREPKTPYFMLVRPK
jgi:mono/diheme cytochrome c family protein